MRVCAALFGCLLACGETAVDHAPSVTLASDTFTCECTSSPASWATITLDYYAGSEDAQFHVLEARRTLTSKDGGATGLLVKHVTPAGSGVLTPEQHLEVTHDDITALAATNPCGFAFEALEVDVTGPLGATTLKRGARPYVCMP